MNRRLMMAQQKSENWDFSWNYKQGLLSDFLPLKKTGNTPTETMTEKGVLISANQLSTNITYATIPPTSNVAVLEIKFEIKTMVDTSPTTGFRLRLSNGVKGCQLILNGASKIGYESGNNLNNATFIVKKPLDTDTEYLIRMEYDINNGNKVTVNGELLYEGKAYSQYWCTRHSIMQQEWGSTYLKEVRFKHIA